MPASVKAASSKELENVGRAKKNPSRQIVKRPPELRPWSSSVKGSLTDLEEAVLGARRVTETVCGTPIVKLTSPGQGAKKAGKGRKKKESVTSLPEIRKCSGKFTTPQLVYEGESFGDGFGKAARDLSSSVLHPREQKARLVSKLSLPSSSVKVGCADVERKVPRLKREDSNSTVMKSSVKPHPPRKSTKKVGVNGIKKDGHAARPSAWSFDEPTSKLSCPGRLVAESTSGSGIKSASWSKAISEACSPGPKFQKSQKQCRNFKINRGGVAGGSDREKGVWMADKPKSQTSKVQQVEKRPEPQTSKVKHVDKRPKSQTSKVQVVGERPKSQISNVKVVKEMSKSQTSQMWPARESPKSEISNVQFVDEKPKFQVSRTQLAEERSKSQTSDVPASSGSKEDALFAVSACFTHSLHSQDDGGNTTDDAEDLPESENEEFFLDRLSH